MILKDLQQYDLVYLATPYTLYAEGLDAAFREACRIANILIVKGIRVHSPIVAGHSLTVETGLSPSAVSMWYWYNDGFMRKSDCLVIGAMTGWNESAGINHEIDIFAEMRKPIYLLNPHTHEVVPWRGRYTPPAMSVAARQSCA